MRLQSFSALVCSLALLAPGATAQSFNVDFGVAFGAPSASYGGAANQPGFWNSIPSTGGFAWSLVDISGTPTGVMTLATRPNGSFPTEFAGDSFASGDDEALLDDFMSATVADVSVSGLANGSYDVWFYCLATDVPNLDWFTGIFPQNGFPYTIGGTWPGSHQYSVTHVDQCIAVTSGELNVRISGYIDFATLNGVQIVQRSSPCANAFPESCHGDGGGAYDCSSCPCANDAAPGTEGGCLNSLGSSARLLGSGVPSASADSLRVTGTGLSPSNFSMLVSGDNVALQNPVADCFGLQAGFPQNGLNGLRCVIGNFQRHGVRATAADGSVGASTAGWGFPDGPTGGILQQGGFAAGQTRHFQLFYRDSSFGTCNSSVNTSQATSVEFVP